MLSFADGDGIVEIPVSPDSHLDAIRFFNAGSGPYNGRNWSYCSAEIRLGNYRLAYRLDVADDPKGCEPLARRDIESIRQAVDTLIDRGP